MSDEAAPKKTDFAEVLKDELKLITIRRAGVRAKAPQPPGSKPAIGPKGSIGTNSAKPVSPDPEKVPEDPQKEARLETLHRHVAGLALSGGGIRSATFALGVLQGLADLKILSRFDYLSTVSGGGYVGGWLAAWLRREGDPLTVEKQLSPSRITQADVERLVIGKQKIVDEEPEPIHHLRSYSNYLTPRPGLLSVDTWTILTIYIRNALINILLLLPLTILIVLMGRWIVWFFALDSGSNTLRSGVILGFLGSFGLALLSLGFHIRTIQVEEPETGESKTASRWRSAVNWPLNPTVIWPLVLAAILGAWSFTLPPLPGVVYSVRPGLPADRMTIRLPDSPHLVRGLQPHINESAFWFIEALPHFCDDAYKAWKVDQQFLWISALEFGTWFGLVAVIIHVLGYLILWLLKVDPDTMAKLRGEQRNRLRSASYLAFCALIAGFTGGVLFLAVMSEILWRHYDLPDLMATLGPPLVLMVFVLATFIEVWLLGRWQGDDLREWWARVCAWLTIYACAWLAFFSLTLYGPMLANHLLGGTLPLSAAGLGWLLTSAGGAFAGRSPESGRLGGTRLVKLLVRVAPPVFVVGLLVAVSWFVDKMIFDKPQDRVNSILARQDEIRKREKPDWEYALRENEARKAEQNSKKDVCNQVILVETPKPLPPASESELRRVLEGSSLRALWSGLVTVPISRIFLVQGICVALALAATWMSNVNLFSMNSMYANRLTRCYLGASRKKREWERREKSWNPGCGGAPTRSPKPDRRENPFTGFDLKDDIPLSELKIGSTQRGGVRPLAADAEYLGPHLIINTALNLVAGDELAWQDRKAESFVLTPTYCGSKDTGYAPTSLETIQELTLGRAMSISGAAVDSNIGLHQSSDLIALMTAFNARLGWWIRNPNPETWLNRFWIWGKRRTTWDAASPSLALPLLLELLGQTDARKEWVHLSDGGHFENLGVYELVRRRCRYIVSCDSGTDPLASDDNLANMIRLCRIDFGVRIEIDTTGFTREGTEKNARWHCAVGQIRYDDVDDGELPGTFVYLRTSMTGDEPPDIQEYSSKNPDFPWESTLDQFFDEPQFESYRALGFHVGQSTFKEAVAEVEDHERLWSNWDSELEFKRGNQRLFSAVQRRWAPSPSHQNASYVHAARSWVEFQKALLTEKELTDLGRRIYPERTKLSAGSPEVHAVAQMIEVMEGAWVDLKLSGFRDLPMNRGWMTVFRRWAATPDFWRFWPILRGEFAQDFVNFCETNLALGTRVELVDRSKLESTYFDEVIKAFGEEFAREWPAQKPLKTLIANAHATWGGRDAPLSLVLLAPPGKEDIIGADGVTPTGIVFASQILNLAAPGTDPDHFEVFFWMRRPYRGLGLGSRCAKEILINFRTQAQGNKPRDITVQTRYPAEGGKHRDEMEYLLWRSFYSHYDFSKPSGKQTIQEGDYVIERTFKPEDPEL
jgi:hypothetical protein